MQNLLNFGSIQNYVYINIDSDPETYNITSPLDVYQPQFI